MRIRLATALAAGILALGAGAAPVAPAAAAPATAADTPKTEALVRRLLTEMHFEAQMDLMLKSMLPMMMEQQARQYPSLTSDQRQMILETTQQVMREKFMPKLMDRAIPIYAATYSEAELEAMVAFYGSPTGQAILNKTPSITPKIAAATRELLPEMTGEMMRALCAKMNCLQPSPAPVPKARPS